jgi:hypothetical protein
MWIENIACKNFPSTLSVSNDNFLRGNPNFYFIILFIFSLIFFIYLFIGLYKFGGSLMSYMAALSSRTTFKCKLRSILYLLLNLFPFLFFLIEDNTLIKCGGREFMLFYFQKTNNKKRESWFGE